MFANFKSLPQLLDYFKEETTCIAYYERIRWNGNPVCPKCGSHNPYKTTRGWKCSNPECLKKFTVKIGSVFENSKISFRTWFAALYIISSHKKGISSVQLAIDLDITQKTAWFVLHRIRELMKNQAPQMLDAVDPVEVDETRIGGREKNRHRGKKQDRDNPNLSRDGKPYNHKKIVVGIVQRNGMVVLKHVPSTKAEDLIPFINQYVPKGSRIMTDEHTSYQGLNKDYFHSTVIHSIKLYVVGDTHTNSIESFWNGLKRGLYGIYHCVSDKHLDRYLNEFASRFNSRKIDAYVRFEYFLSKSHGGLLYKNLIANV